MSVSQLVRTTNRSMIAFDLLLGSGALAAPDLTLKAIGHDAPSPDARTLFQRCGPIWLTYAAAHLLADRRGSSEDWAAVAWLRGTEILTDVVWASSPAIPRRRSRVLLRLAGAFNLALAVGAYRERR
ncbi:hypothetical protein [Patulibacter defluvii]|uniref:hypothetical protein n=1 Tax=Patulibacter defluvii TaxID=3095358 RepID=UPI002A753C49|nr:hypothetical protein [Patulibacter sp. DM4]